MQKNCSTWFESFNLTFKFFAWKVYDKNFNFVISTPVRVVFFFSDLLSVFDITYNIESKSRLVMLLLNLNFWCDFSCAWRWHLIYIHVLSVALKFVVKPFCITKKRYYLLTNFTNVTNKGNQNCLAFEEFRKFISLSVFDGHVESMSFYCGLHFKYQITILLNLNKNLMSNYNETLGFMLDHC